MTPRVFTVSARGAQSWAWADITVNDGRATIVVDDDEDRAVRLTKMQTAELSRWLAQVLA